MDFSKVISTAAPWIGTALAGPLGGMAAQVASRALGLTEKTAGELQQVFENLDSEQVLCLRKADLEFSFQMKALGFKQFSDLEALASNDRKDARSMQVVARSWVPAALSVIITVGFLGLLTGMMLGFLKAEDNQAMLLMLGALGVAFGQCTNFWLGSTAGSQNKDILLANSK
jgi:hypothetical protein